MSISLPWLDARESEEGAVGGIGVVICGGEGLLGGSGRPWCFKILHGEDDADSMEWMGVRRTVWKLTEPGLAVLSETGRGRGEWAGESLTDRRARELIGGEAVGPAWT